MKGLLREEGRQPQNGLWNPNYESGRHWAERTAHKAEQMRKTQEKAHFQYILLEQGQEEEISYLLSPPETHFEKKGC